MTFIQLYESLENFLRGWLLVLDLKECLVEYAKLCVKSEVIHTNKDVGPIVDLICGRYDKTREPSQPGQVGF